MARDAGNNRRTARRITFGQNPRTFNDSLSRTDKADFFRFVVQARSSFDGEVFNIPKRSNFNFQLQNANGRGIALSARPGRRPENISVNLEPGVYFARVFWRKGAGKYRMRLSLNPDTAGETLATARDIGNLNGSASLQEYVGTSDPADVYRFTLDERLTFGATLSPLSASADIALLDAGGNLITNTAGSGTTARSLQQVLNPGTYFIRTTPAPGAKTRYNLAFNTSPAPDQGGNDFGSAAAIPGFGFFPASVQEYVGNSDPADYYTFSTTIAGDLKIDLTNIAPTADLNITLFDQFQSVLAIQGGAGAGGNEQITLAGAQPGQYFVLVQPAGPGNNSSYRLTAVLTPEDKFGDTFTDATVITDPLSPGLTSPLSNDLDNPSIYQDFVGGGDVDVFRFTLTENLNFLSVRLKDFTGNLSLELFQAGNGTPISAGGSTLRGALSPGTYFLRVSPGAANVASTYTMEAAYGERQSGIIVRDVNPGALDSNADFLTDVQGALFYAANDGSSVGLWRSEGTLNTTVKVGSFTSITNITNVNGTVYFAGGTVATGVELWKWQPTGGLGTLSLVADIAPANAPSSTNSSPINLTAAGNNLFFLASPTGNPVNRRLYFTNGGTATEIANAGSGPESLVYVQATDTLYYIADLQGVGSNILFRITGASTANPGAPVALQNLGAGPTAFGPRFVDSLKVVGDDVFFVASEAINTNNRELRRIAANGDVFTYDIDGDPNSGSIGSGNLDVTVVTSGGQSYAYFTAFDSVAVALQLIRVDLATGISERVSTNITSEFVASNLTVFDGKVYFTATTLDEGTELWVTDPAGTLEVTALDNLVPGAGSSLPNNLVVAGGTLYFTADNGSTGNELYRLNATTGLPELALDINPGGDPSNPSNLIAAGSLSSGLGQLFFVADDGVNGREVWTV